CIPRESLSSRLTSLVVSRQAPGKTWVLAHHLYIPTRPAARLRGWVAKERPVGGSSRSRVSASYGSSTSGYSDLLHRNIRMVQGRGVGGNIARVAGEDLGRCV